MRPDVILYINSCLSDSVCQIYPELFLRILLSWISIANPFLPVNINFYGFLSLLIFSLFGESFPDILVILFSVTHKLQEGYITMKKIWIVGSSGHMGQALIRLLDMMEYELYETDKDELIPRMNMQFPVHAPNRPDVVINCAGYHPSAGAAQSETDMAYKVNAVGAKNWRSLRKAFRQNSSRSLRMMYFPAHRHTL